MSYESILAIAKVNPVAIALILTYILPALFLFFLAKREMRNAKLVTIQKVHPAQGEIATASPHGHGLGGLFGGRFRPAH